MPQGNTFSNKELVIKPQHYSTIFSLDAIFCIHLAALRLWPQFDPFPTMFPPRPKPNNKMLLISTLLFSLQCTAFSFHAISGIRTICVNHHKHTLCTKSRPSRMCSFLSSLSQEYQEEEYVRHGANIVVISKPEDYVKFLEEDDRLCVIKWV